MDDKALVSWLLYPNVFPELVRHRDEYSDTSVIPTPVFLYGLEPGQETTIEIEPGKMLIVRLVAIGKLEKDGTRDLIFELNGEARTHHGARPGRGAGAACSGSRRRRATRATSPRRCRARSSR